MDGVTRSNVSGSPLDSVWKRESPWSYLLGELRSTTGLALSRTLDTTRIKSRVQTIPNPALGNRNYNPAELGCSLFCSRNMTKERKSNSCKTIQTTYIMESSLKILTDINTWIEIIDC